MLDTRDIDLANEARLIARDGPVSVFELDAGCGRGLMTFLELYPGVSLIVSEFHGEVLDSAVRVGCESLCVDHCREGRLEWLLDGERRLYLAKGRAIAHTHEKFCSSFHLPTHAYRGLTIALFVEQAQASLDGAITDFAIDLSALRLKLCPELQPCMLARPLPEHFLASFYASLAKERLVLLRIKLLELLLFLDSLPPAQVGEDQYYCRSHVEKVKAIERLLVANPAERLSIPELARRFALPETTLKACFKGVFGNSINAYMRERRMRLAAELLLESSLSVTEVAVRVGYESPSKFAAAFRAQAGVTPTDYRKGAL
ncbi:MAG: AraC family transcriptional regulator [Coriobacteriales bacterium]|jgi:AraC-like DNA-binding protein|nr:AraC family transcriptional regulator [Coriobacteriales bacterium]